MGLGQRLAPFCHRFSKVPGRFPLIRASYSFLEPASKTGPSFYLENYHMCMDLGFRIELTGGSGFKYVLHETLNPALPKPPKP